MLACALSFCPAARGDGPRWLKIKTPNFEVFTTAGERSGREVARHFEQVRSFFLEAMGWGLRSGPPIRIVAFRSEKEFQPYAPNEVAAAFYLGAEDRDYIVMRTAALESFPVAVHEYIHLLVKHSGHEVPVWFNEGLAEFYSNLKPMGSKVEVGAVIMPRFMLLRQSQWIDLRTLLAVDHDSPLYNEKSRAGVFYAECWALIHMLYLDAEYRPRLPVLLEGIKADSDMTATFQKAYYKTIEQVERDLKLYMGGSRFNAAVVNSKLPKSADAPEVSESSELEAGLVLAEILASRRDKADAARTMYERLAREHPKDWQIEDALARLSWREERSAETLSHYARAAELGSTSAPMFYQYGLLLRVEGKPAEAIAALRRAAELDNTDVKTHLELGILYVTQDDFPPALEQLQAIKKVTPDQAFSYFHTLAYANYRLGRKEPAASALASCRKYARHPEEMNSVEQLAAALQEAPAPPAEPQRLAGAPVTRALQSRAPLPEVQGTLKQIDCQGKNIRFQILADGKVVSLIMRNPAAVEIKGLDTGSMQFACGPQKPRRIRAAYEAETGGLPGTAGSIRTLEFLP